MSSGVAGPVVVVVGNPKPRSRTWSAANAVAASVSGRPADLVIDLADLGPALLDWSDAEVAETVAAVGRAALLVVASPTFKATYSGLLKLFLDRLPAGGLTGTVAVPMMLGAGSAHALAAELHLRPVLSELGASTPAPALFLLESAYVELAEEYAARWGSVLRAVTQSAGHERASQLLGRPEVDPCR
jgi:FMN reductase